MEPFKQRIATFENMGRMNAERIHEYISYRIKIAGGSSSLFKDTGWEALHHAFGSENIPRLINSLCDKSLTIAFEHKKSAVDVDDVYKAAEGMGLQKEVFFYKIKLKKQSQEAHIPSNGGSAAEERAAEKAEQDAVSESTTAAPVTRRVTSIASPEKQFKVDLPTGEKKSLIIPVTLFILSVAAVVLSTLFYCQKSNSSDLISCISELIGM